MPKIQQVKDQYTITIPKGYILEKGWEKGTLVVFGYDPNGHLVIKECKK